MTKQKSIKNPQSIFKLGFIWAFHILKGREMSMVVPFQHAKIWNRPVIGVPSVRLPRPSFDPQCIAHAKDRNLARYCANLKCSVRDRASF